MKKTNFLILIVITASLNSVANNIDTLDVCFKNIQIANEKIQTLQERNTSLEKELVSTNEIISHQSATIDSLNAELSKTNQNISALADSLDINITSTRNQIVTNSETINQTIAKKSQTDFWIFIAIGVVLIFLALIFGILIARRKNEVESLSAKADKINEEIVNRMSTEMNEMQSISKQISALSNVSGGNTDSEQALIKTLADRITFMEMTLYKMDSSVRGHKQLSKSIKQMKDNLLANGYELVDMLGKDYHDGMKVTANFVEDEDLPQGKQVITGIIKPQINYKGKMIQAAQITVSQN